MTRDSIKTKVQLEYEATQLKGSYHEHFSIEPTLVLTIPPDLQLEELEKNHESVEGVLMVLRPDARLTSDRMYTLQVYKEMIERFVSFHFRM